MHDRGLRSPSSVLCRLGYAKCRDSRDALEPMINSGMPADGGIWPGSGNPSSTRCLAYLRHITYLCSIDPGSRQLWYQSRTACRKPLPLVDVESSGYENYLKEQNDL